MTNRPSRLRFDHREIAVIFSLFVFVSLLMFTVGILVGKGLSQARLESHMVPERKLSLQAPTGEPKDNLAVTNEKSTGNSVSSPSPDEHPIENSGKKENKEPTAKADPVEAAPLHLVPQKPRDTELGATTLLEPRTSQEAANQLMKNPKIKQLIEEDPKAKRASGKMPEAAANGKYLVQVGSYPTEKDAADRVDTLKKLGFPFANFSAKELGDNRETWFRVWLGFYPDYDSANEAGRILRERGEVKQYLVRKADTSG